MSGTSYPKGAKAWYSNAEYVSTADNNTTTPVADGASWIKLNDLSGTSGGSSVTCGWDADKIASIISSLSTLSSTISTMESKIDIISQRETASTYAWGVSQEDFLIGMTDIDTANYGVLALDGYILPKAPTSSSITAAVQAKVTFPAGEVSILTLPTNRLPAGTRFLLLDSSGSTLSDASCYVKYELVESQFSTSGTDISITRDNNGINQMTISRMSESNSVALGNSALTLVKIVFPEFVESDSWKYRVDIGTSGDNPITKTIIVGKLGGVNNVMKCIALANSRCAIHPSVSTNNTGSWSTSTSSYTSQTATTYAMVSS